MDDSVNKYCYSRNPYNGMCMDDGVYPASYSRSRAGLVIAIIAVVLIVVIIVIIFILTRKKKTSSTSSGGPGTNLGLTCKTTADCLNNKICNTALGRCVECLDDSLCKSPTPKCELTGNTCIQCIISSDCPIAGSTCSGGKCCTTKIPVITSVVPANGLPSSVTVNYTFSQAALGTTQVNVAISTLDKTIIFVKKFLANGPITVYSADITNKYSLTGQATPLVVPGFLVGVPYLVSIAISYVCETPLATTTAYTAPTQFIIPSCNDTPYITPIKVNSGLEDPSLDNYNGIAAAFIKGPINPNTNKPPPITIGIIASKTQSILTSNPNLAEFYTAKSEASIALNNVNVMLAQISWMVKAGETVYVKIFIIGVKCNSTLSPTAYKLTRPNFQVFGNAANSSFADISYSYSPPISGRVDANIILTTRNGTIIYINKFQSLNPAPDGSNVYDTARVYSSDIIYRYDNTGQNQTLLVVPGLLPGISYYATVIMTYTGNNNPSGVVTSGMADPSNPSIISISPCYSTSYIAPIDSAYRNPSPEFNYWPGLAYAYPAGPSLRIGFIGSNNTTILNENPNLAEFYTPVINTVTGGGPQNYQIAQVPINYNFNFTFYVRLFVLGSGSNCNSDLSPVYTMVFIPIAG